MWRGAGRKGPVVQPSVRAGLWQITGAPQIKDTLSPAGRSAALSAHTTEGGAGAGRPPGTLARVGTRAGAATWEPLPTVTVTLVTAAPSARAGQAVWANLIQLP